MVNSGVARMRGHGFDRCTYQLVSLPNQKLSREKSWTQLSCGGNKLRWGKKTDCHKMVTKRLEAISVETASPKADAVIVKSKLSQHSHE